MNWDICETGRAGKPADRGHFMGKGTSWQF
jgi:hypothetical protein